MSDYQEKAAEGTQVFVGNLDFSTTEEDLQKLFEKFGNIHKVNLVLDRESGRPRGFGFVTFEEFRDAEDAVKDLDNTPFMGRDIKVNLAKEKAPRGQGGGGGGRFGGSDRGRRDSPYGGGGRDGGYGGGRGGGRSGGGGGGGGCFKCGKDGHFARECPESGDGGGRDGGYGGGRGGGRSGGGGGGECYKCGKGGHFARECPDAGGRGGGF